MIVSIMLCIIDKILEFRAIVSIIYFTHDNCMKLKVGLRTAR